MNKKISLQSVKIDLVQKILAVTNESLLNKVNNMLEKEVIVAYSVDGKPLTLKEYNQDLESAEAAINKGNFVKNNQLKEEIKKWKKSK